MTETMSSEILKEISRGDVFTASDFLAIWKSRDAVDQALSRLARKGTIRRLGRGLYDYPRMHEGLGPLSPTEDAIANAIARRDNIQIQPSGQAAANALGLSTQVPARSVYLTNGRSRTINALGREIEFRHRKLNNIPGAASLAINALRAIGPEAASDPEVAGILKRRLGQDDKQRLRDALRHMPEWMRPIVRQVSSDYDHE